MTLLLAVWALVNVAFLALACLVGLRRHGTAPDKDPTDAAGDYGELIP